MTAKPTGDTPTGKPQPCKAGAWECNSPDCQSPAAPTGEPQPQIPGVTFETAQQMLDALASKTRRIAELESLLKLVDQTSCHPQIRKDIRAALAGTPRTGE